MNKRFVVGTQVPLDSRYADLFVLRFMVGA